MSPILGRETAPGRLSSFVTLSGAAIANSLGVPGTLGTLARTRHDGRPVLLSTWHVLFGEGADEQTDVWLVEAGRRSQRIGRTLYGKAGAIAFEGAETYVDCAVASWEGEGDGTIAGYDRACVGDRVTKHGAATGITHGMVVRVDYDDVAGKRQLLVRSLDETRPFSAAGDSGALLVNDAGNAVGLLWGATRSGEGVACPIAPVLHAMNIDLAAGVA